MSSTHTSLACRTCGGLGWVVRTPPGGVPQYVSGGLTIVLPCVTTYTQCGACVERMQPKSSITLIPATPPWYTPEAPTP